MEYPPIETIKVNEFTFKIDAPLSQKQRQQIRRAVNRAEKLGLAAVKPAFENGKRAGKEELRAEIRMVFDMPREM